MTAAMALAALWVSAAGPAVRPAPPTLGVSLDVAGCPFLRGDEVARLAALELDAPVTTAPSAGEQVTRVKVACADSRIEITVLESMSATRMTRTLPLAADEKAVLARLVAIAASELVITSWIELALPRPSAASAATPAPPPDVRRAAEEHVLRRLPRRGSGHVLLLANAVGPFTGIGLSWGGTLRLGWTPGGAPAREDDAHLVRRLGADLDLGVARTEVGSALGIAQVSMWSTALRASLRLYRGRTWLDAGAGARVGLARMTGVPFDATTTRGTTLAGTWGGPLAYLGIGVRIWRFVVATGIEAGVVLREVSGLVQDGTAVSVSGRWYSGTVGVGWGE
jgi:hypothetical protein